jgi:type I restriction enzyme S subunit
VLNQELKKVSAGSTFDAIGYRELSQIKIPAPPTIEMTKITTYLDSETAKIHQAINNIQSQIEKLEEYRKSLIYEVVTGKVRVS